MKNRHALVLVNGLLLGSVSFAADCPNPLRCLTPRVEACKADERPTADERPPPGPDVPIELTADDIDRSPNRDIVGRGNAEARHGNRTLRAQEIEYSEKTGAVRIPGSVELADPHLVLTGESAQVDAAGAAQFEGTTFAIPARAGHGSADLIRLSSEGVVDLQDVRYTTCPTPNPDWELKIDKLHIDQKAHIGSGLGARVDFKGVPIFYLPYISFPVGDEPKSGFLYPQLGHSSRSGWQFSAPWYWRASDSYDATLTPTWYSARGLDTGGELRFLTERHKGTLNVNYLADDRQTGEDRSFVQLSEQTDFTSRLRLVAAAVNLGDHAWLEDFGSPGYHSIVALPRSAEVIYRADEWSVHARAFNYQIIDPEIELEDRPYTMLPQMFFQGYFPDRLFGITAAVDGEFVSFRRNAEHLSADTYASAQRFDVEPQFSLPLQRNGIYLKPAASLRYTSYRLSGDAESETLSRTAPTFSLGGGMVFERDADASRTSVMQTLEPRFLYAYVPYRNQDALPVLDTTTPDFNLVQLFKTHRYVGADRLGDVNHVALGLTNRWFGADGRQILTATVGELYRFASERVVLPGETPERRGTSDVIGELDIAAYRRLSAHLGLQWDPKTEQNERTEVGLQYRVDTSRVFNVAYRYRRRNTLAGSEEAASQPENDGLEQADASVAWPIGPTWSAFGRMVYSLKDKKAIERLGGLEYRSCCWGVRLIALRSVSSITGGSNWEIKAQLELTGLSNVGNPVDTFLTQSIQGYSAARNDFSSTP